MPPLPSLALMGLLLAAATPAAAQAPAHPPAPAPEAQPFEVGALELVALHDADFQISNDGKTFGVDAGPAAVAELLRASGRATDKIPVSIDALLVRMPGRLVLIDTGLGAPSLSALQLSLKAAGVRADDVTDVLITHSHGDHVGGLVTPDHRPAFPNAKIRMSVKEWAFMQSQPGARPIASVIAPQVVPFEPGTMVAPGITAVAIAGHTPGHVGYEITSEGARILDIGDSAHSSVVSLERPDWVMGFDSDPAVGKASRRALLARLASSHELIFAPHFPFPGVGRVATSGSGFVFEPSLK